MKFKSRRDFIDLYTLMENSIKDKIPSFAIGINSCHKRVKISSMMSYLKLISEKTTVSIYLENFVVFQDEFEILLKTFRSIQRFTLAASRIDISEEFDVSNIIFNYYFIGLNGCSSGNKSLPDFSDILEIILISLSRSNLRSILNYLSWAGLGMTESFVKGLLKSTGMINTHWYMLNSGP